MSSSASDRFMRKPIIQQVRWFDLLDAGGDLRRCSRTENPELFRLAIGGFGVIARLELQLRPRIKVRRVVETAETAGIIEQFESRIRDGYLYGDFQFATDASHDSFLQRGIFSTYQPVADDTPLTPNPTRFNPEDWARLTFYAHKYKRRAFEVYSTRYLATSGQIYWADSQLSAAYVDNYHADIDRALRSRTKATEMITEIYVQRPQFPAFMRDAAVALQRWPLARRQLLPHLPSLGAEGPGRALLSRDAGVPGEEARVRPRGALPEHLVSPLPRDVRRLAAAALHGNAEAHGSQHARGDGTDKTPEAPARAATSTPRVMSTSRLVWCPAHPARRSSLVALSRISNRFRDARLTC